MTHIKSYIYAVLLIALGALIGWLVKPTIQIANSSDHEHTAAIQVEGKIFTCSMHPQVRQNEPGICPICEMDLIPLDNSMGSDDPTILQMSKEAVKLAQVETTVVGATTDHDSPISARSIPVEGAVHLDDRTIHVQSAHMGGRIENMSVNFEGQYITKGKKVATIYSTELLQASQELLTAAKLEDKMFGITDASIQKLKNWKISDQLIQQILETKRPIETVDIYAEESGYILERRARIGDYVAQGGPLYTIGKTSRVWLIFNVFESDMDLIHTGQKITFTSPAIGHRNLTTQVSYIDPILDQQTRTARVRAEIVNPKNILKPGMLLTATIHLQQTKSSEQAALTVPNSALLWTGQESVVYVQLPDEEIPSFQYREVTIGERMGDVTVITDGLETGDRVVTHGAFAIDAASQLNNNMSMMNKNVTIKKEASLNVLPDYVDVAPRAFKEQLKILVSTYVQLKDALVATDATTARQAGSLFLTQLSAIDMSLITGDAHSFWMEQLSALRGYGQKIADTEDIDDQRDQFDFLSTALINSLRAFGTVDETYFVQYCPMAKDNTGASWIALESQIQNPYFGSKMMKCGVVKLEL